MSKSTPSQTVKPYVSWEYAVVDQTLIGYRGTQSIAVVPAVVKRIGPFAFEGNLHLSKIALPEGVQSIGQEAFSGCTNLKIAYLPSSLKKIEAKAFYGCDSLRVIKLPLGLEEIAASAFEGTKSLDTITLPEQPPYLGTFTDFDSFKYDLEDWEVTCELNKADPSFTDLLVSGKKIASLYSFPLEEFEDRLVKSDAPSQSKAAILKAFTAMVHCD